MIGHQARSRIRRTVVVLVASTLLSACGVTHQTLPPIKVDAVPSLSINTPLLVSGCALTHCWAAGSTTVQGIASTLIERRLDTGGWISVPAPSTDGDVRAMACSNTTCVIGGSRNGQDFLWSTSMASATLSSHTVPTGTGVDALSCTVEGCMAIDHTANGTYRLVNGSDLSIAPVSTLAAGTSVTSFSCTSSTQCWLGASTAAGQAVVLTTSDGVSWTAVTTPTWASVLSLWCDQHCVALTQDASTQYVARQTGSGWTTTRVPFIASALSCVSSQRCVVVGQHDSAAGAGAVWSPDQLQPLIVHYAPTPLTRVGCSTSDCVAVGATTVLSLRP
jgi:hypothetical protein